MSGVDARPRNSLTLLYFAIAYGIAWFAWGVLFSQHWSHLAGPGLWLYLVAVFAPHMSAIIVTCLEGGPLALREFYARVLRRTASRWVILAILVPPAVYLARDALFVVGALAHEEFIHAPERTLALLIFGQIAVVLGEEPGWRGFALPRLSAQFGPLVATLILGAAWSLWHLPLFVVAGTSQYGTPFVPFLITLTAWSLIITLLVMRSRGSTIPAMLFHGSANVCDYVLWEPEQQGLTLGPWVLAATIAAWRIRTAAPRRLRTPD